ncbi:MAG: hypothetical protein AABW56_04770 [Nanoarchaeota archaeon]
MLNFHSKISGSKWNGDFLRDTKNEIIELYGADSISLKKLEGIPKEVITFLQRVKSLKL